MSLRLITCFLLLAAFSMAQEATRPPCTKQNHGQLWPDEANTDRAAARRAASCGELQMCARGTWKYRWESLTVHVSDLGKDPKRQRTGCAEPLAQSAVRAAR